MIGQYQRGELIVETLESVESLDDITGRLEDKRDHWLEKRKVGKYEKDWLRKVGLDNVRSIG